MLYLWQEKGVFYRVRFFRMDEYEVLREDENISISGKSGCIDFIGYRSVRFVLEYLKLFFQLLRVKRK